MENRIMTLDDNPQLLDDAIPSEDEIAQSIMELVSLFLLSEESGCQSQ